MGGRISFATPDSHSRLRTETEKGYCIVSMQHIIRVEWEGIVNFDQLLSIDIRL